MPLSPIAVLFVDDNAALLELLGLIAEQTDDIAVWSLAASGADALAQLTQAGLSSEGASGVVAGLPAVVVSDVSMPRMDGFELVAAIAEQWPSLPCVVLSSHPSNVYAARARAAGAVAYVEKGRPDELLGAIRQAAVSA